MIKFFCVSIIKLYRKFISPIKKPCCRFYPTCSTYAMEAFQKHSTLKATYLTIYRVIRCNPFCKGGYDPVP